MYPDPADDLRSNPCRPVSGCANAAPQKRCGGTGRCSPRSNERVLVERAISALTDAETALAAAVGGARVSPGDDRSLEQILLALADSVREKARRVGGG